MVRLDRTIQKPLQRLKKDFSQPPEGILDTPKKPERMTMFANFFNFNMRLIPK
jgi:hypothetical protein